MQVTQLGDHVCGFEGMINSLIFYNNPCNFKIHGLLFYYKLFLMILNRRINLIFFDRGINLIILDSSMVEHSAVNRVVAGSSPARGADHSIAVMI